MGDETGKQNTVCREIRKNFVRVPINRLLSIHKKAEISEIFSVLRTEMAWSDETRHQFCMVPAPNET